MKAFSYDLRVAYILTGQEVWRKVAAPIHSFHSKQANPAAVLYSPNLLIYIPAGEGERAGAAALKRKANFSRIHISSSCHRDISSHAGKQDRRQRGLMVGPCPLSPGVSLNRTKILFYLLCYLHPVEATHSP